MCSERLRLEEQIKLIESQLKQLPAGKLICKRNETRYKWYNNKDGKQIYIPKKERKLAEKLAARKYPEQLKHKTASGNVVRSKSEVLIDMALFKHQIPFQYEAPLHLGDEIFYPDFTIRHPHTGKIFYWEHFGKMDDPKYANNTVAKIRFYINHGIIPGGQLITTYETLEKPLSLETVENVINEYFL